MTPVSSAAMPSGSAFPGIAHFTSARVGAPATLSLVAEKPETAASAKAELMIRLIGQATDRTVDALDKLRKRDETVALLEARIAQLDIENQAAKETIGALTARANAAEELCERLEQDKRSQNNDLERLKTNIDRLMAIFTA